MRKTKWRGTSGKDKVKEVKEATRRLRGILKNSKKLCVTPEDLTGLHAVSRLRTACQRGEEPSAWMFLGVLAVGVLISVLILLIAGGGLMESLSCANNSTKEIQVQTVRLDRLPLEGSQDQTEDSTLFNDSEDSEDSHLWQPPQLRLRKER